MLIKFLRDFRSAATGELFFEAGQTADLERAYEIVAEGAAEIVTIDSRRGQVKEEGLSKAEQAPAPPKKGHP